jgi:hypothetical protein
LFSEAAIAEDSNFKRPFFSSRSKRRKIGYRAIRRSMRQGVPVWEVVGQSRR